MALELSAPDAAPRALACGEELLLRLPETPGTGYRWQVHVSGGGQLALAEERFEAGGAAPGAAGQRLVRFVARQAGPVSVQAVLGRSWEPAEAALERREFTLNVTA